MHMIWLELWLVPILEFYLHIHGMYKYGQVQGDYVLIEAFN